jgi:hypothetical protein
MNILRSRRARLAALTVGLAASAVPVLAQSASAADQNCRFIFTSLNAVDVQEEGFLTNGDEIFLTLDGQRFPATGTVKFRADGATAGPRSFGSPLVPFSDSNPLTVKLLEDDTIINDRIGTVKNLECTGDQTAQVLRFKERRAEYLLTYDIDLV